MNKMLISRERVIELGTEILDNEELGKLIKQLPHSNYVYLTRASEIGEYLDRDDVKNVLYSNVEMDENGRWYSSFISKKEYIFQVVEIYGVYVCIINKNVYTGDYCKTFKELLFKSKNKIKKYINEQLEYIFKDIGDWNNNCSYDSNNIFWLSSAVENINGRFTYIYDGEDDHIIESEDCYYDLVAFKHMGKEYVIPVPILSNALDVDATVIYVALQGNLKRKDFV